MEQKINGKLVQTLLKYRNKVLSHSLRNQVEKTRGLKLLKEQMLIFIAKNDIKIT